MPRRPGQSSPFWILHCIQEGKRNLPLPLEQGLISSWLVAELFPFPLSSQMAR